MLANLIYALTIVLTLTAAVALVSGQWLTAGGCVVAAVLANQLHRHVSR